MSQAARPAYGKNVEPVIIGAHQDTPMRNRRAPRRQSCFRKNIPLFGFRATHAATALERSAMPQFHRPIAANLARLANHFHRNGRAQHHPPMAPQVQPGSHPGMHLQGLAQPHLPARADPAVFNAGARHQPRIAPRQQTPVGVTDVVRLLHVTRANQTRHGSELQTLVYRKQTELGVMTRYPEDRAAVADILRRALECPFPRVINLRNPGDGGYDESYVDRMSEGKTVRVGDLYVRKETIAEAACGPNSEGGLATRKKVAITLTKTLLHVYDPRKPEAGWRTVEHHAVKNWVDRTALPLATFENVWKAFYVPGLTNQAVIHCLGGVGRTAVVLFRLAFQAYMDHENACGRTVSPQQASGFLHEIVEEARRMRGGFVLPDDDQARLLYESCLLGVQNQRVAGPGRPHPGAVPRQAPVRA